MDRAVEQAFSELCLGPELDVNDEAAVRAWLARHEVPDTDVEYLLERGVGPLLIYRRLVRDTLRDAVLLALPRTAARLGASFEATFAAFLAERGPRTHYLRDVTEELIEWAAPRWRADLELPDYLVDLARHEALRISLAAQPVGAPPVTQPALDLDRGVAWIEAVRLMRYGAAVHRLPERVDDRSLPEPGPVALLAYRSPEHEVRYLELTPMAADLLESLLGGATLRAALVTAAERHGVRLDDAALGGTAAVLADLAERGVLLGARDGID